MTEKEIPREEIQKEKDWVNVKKGLFKQIIIVYLSKYIVLTL